MRVVSDCLFCKIQAGEIPSTEVASTANTFAFRDLNPVAPTHVLVIPKRHVEGIAAAADGDAELLGRVLLCAQRVARADGIAESGYRLVFNVGADTGNTVPHLHLHVLGGRPMGWPPG